SARESDRTASWQCGVARAVEQLTLLAPEVVPFAAQAGDGVDAVEVGLSACRRPLPSSEPGVLGGVEMRECEPDRREASAELTHEVIARQCLARVEETKVCPAVERELLAKLGEHELFSGEAYCRQGACGSVGLGASSAGRWS